VIHDIGLISSNGTGHGVDASDVLGGGGIDVLRGSVGSSAQALLLLIPHPASLNNLHGPMTLLPSDVYTIDNVKNCNWAILRNNDDASEVISGSDAFEDARRKGWLNFKHGVSIMTRTVI
jgi:hypothetical protein